MAEYKYTTTDIVGTRKLQDTLYLKMADDELLAVDLRSRTVRVVDKGSLWFTIVEGFGFVEWKRNG